MGHVLPGAPPELVPDVVILTEGTGDSKKGALGIYRGQRGRMQIEVVVTGRSCHGSMPWEGLNPLEHGGAIVAEAARRYDAREGFLDHPFLGHGTRTASWARLDTPSDCAVPERLTSASTAGSRSARRRSRRVRDVEALDAVRAARAAGLRVDVAVPPYREKTWRGYLADNPQIYRGWLTPEDHPAIRAAVAAYRAVVTPHVDEPAGGAQRGRAAPGAAGRPLDLLDRRRRLPHPGRTTARSPCPRRSAGSSPATSSTRPCSGSAPASSRTPTASASAWTCASCSTRSRCSPASRAPSPRRVA